MRLLITGGLGYLGGRLAQVLSTQINYEIFLGSRGDSGPPVWLPSVSIVKTKWNTPTSFDELTNGFDSIVHLAGMNAQDCVLSPVEALEVNGLTTGRLLHAAIRQGVKRFVYLSTAHVYGSPLTGVITEENCPIATHPYATSHRAGEDLVMAAHQRGDIEGVVVRLSNSFGSPSSIEANCWMLLVNDLCRQAILTNKMVLHSSGHQKRDFVTLSYVCRAIEHLLELPLVKLGNGLFNVGGKWSPTVLEITQLLAHRIGILTGNKPDIIIDNVNNSDKMTVCSLDYSIQKLLDTGFEYIGDINSELDGLIDFCIKNYNRIDM